MIYHDDSVENNVFQGWKFNKIIIIIVFVVYNVCDLEGVWAGMSIMCEQWQKK